MLKFVGSFCKLCNKSRFSQFSKRVISTTPPKSNPAGQGLSVIFGKYLLLTNTISSGGLLLLGDVCQQEIEYQRNQLPERYDYGRMARMFVVGLALGPVHHYYYLWIAKKWPARTGKIVCWKIFLDQVVMSPLCIAGFFYGMGMLERKDLRQSTEELVNKFKEVYLIDWIVWPPTQFLNFYYLPVKYQVLYINAVTMLYNIFLSYIKHREVAAEYQHQIHFKRHVKPD
ncbi:unnamed protein product [Acanthoscelides obtectus]|uniref:Mpv17-like protein 2 n=1 Tax=Acanthoscelides obtectus TaxID=200917 RepID=A0A9P0JQ59_ACAOB|nr:unnamed protein product [Acanthoscelides obtectus]CAK1621255.1 Mpv17-like protein 2 [Acanthoscelides obtectus]